MKLKKRLLSLLLCMTMLLGMAWPVSAREDGNSSIRIVFAVQKDGAFLFAPQEITVLDGVAEEYGYCLPETASYPTVFDALVTAQKLVFGDGYTIDSARNYLDLADSGFITKAFGEDAFATGFYVNAEMPWDCADSAAIQDGDTVTFFFYQDTAGYSDVYTRFDSFSQTVAAGEPLELTLLQVSYPAPDYTAVWSPVDGTDTENNYITFHLVNEEGSIGEPLQADGCDITPNQEGRAVLSFQEEGTYTVTAQGFVQGYAAIVPPFCTVTVAKPCLEDEEAVQRVYAEFSAKVYGSASQTPLTLPIEYGGETYTNILSYLKAWALKETGRELSVRFDYVSGTTSYPDWRTGKKTDYIPTGFDENGNMTQNYYKDNAPFAQRLSNVYFTVGSAIADRIPGLYVKTESLLRSEEEIVDFVAENLPFSRIQGKNSAQDRIVQPVGELSANGTSCSLPAYDSLYTKNSVSIGWRLEPVSGREDALTLSGNKISVLRPNVKEENAVFRLVATVSSVKKPEIQKEVTYLLTVPAFEPVTVPVEVPEGAVLFITDSYYKTEVPDEYLVRQETASEGYEGYRCLLHTGVSGGRQDFSYVVKKENYITKTGTISVTGTEELPVMKVALTPSSEADTTLSFLQITAAGGAELAFESHLTDYTAEVSGGQYILVSGRAAVEGAEAKISSYYRTLANANKGAFTTAGVQLTEKGVKCYLPDEPGESVIQITVTAPDGSVQPEQTRIYSVTVRKTAENAPLTGLMVTALSSGNGTKDNQSMEGVPSEEELTPGFIPGGREEAYYYTVNFFRDQIRIKPVAAGCHITVNGRTVTSGGESDPIPLEVGDNTIHVNVTDREITTEYVIHVHRKEALFLTDITLKEGELSTALSADGSSRSGSCSFAYTADTVRVTFQTNITDGVSVRVIYDDKIYEGIPGEPMELSVGTAGKILPKIQLLHTVDGVMEGQTYIISFIRKESDAPDAVTSYLPAPGQFVNLEAYRNPGKTLTGTAPVTLGSFGGYIVYRFVNPIRNDPRNPYGIDFLVMGNCFANEDGSTSVGAAEPAAVMVSEDGNVWYELAGSEYDSATSRRQLTVTYQNSDTSFTAASDIPWRDSDGESGVMPKNAYHTQPYYPDPAFYGQYQNGIGKNESYTAESMSFTGTRINAGFYPFGYADTHAQVHEKENRAENPYGANHASVYNGDGFDLSWAVDENGEPVALDCIQYVKIYNPVLSYGTSTGEKSPEIQEVLRAKPESAPVGVSGGLQTLTVNGVEIPLTEGVYRYEVDVQGADWLRILPTAYSDAANIYVSNQRVASGEVSKPLETVDRIRILVQEDTKEPVIYILTVVNGGQTENSADLRFLTLLPGEEVQEPDDTNRVSFTVPNSVAAVRLVPYPKDERASVRLSGQTLTEAVVWSGDADGMLLKLNVGANVFTLTVTARDGSTQKDYLVTVRRKGLTLAADTGTIEVSFSLTGDTVHWDPQTGTELGSHTAPEWIPFQKVLVPKGATVKYLTEMMLTNAGIDFTSDGVYVSEINGLGEMDNGPNSGWMYRHNGKIANEGYAERILSAGDSVVWFYTDDYTREKDYESWTSPEISHGTGVTGKPANQKTQTQEGNEPLPPKSDEADGLREAFPDVTREDWYYKAVEFVSGRKLMQGTGEGFEPNRHMTRAMLVTVLWRMEQEPATDFTAFFKDVTPDAWYAGAVDWAAGEKLISGYGDGVFGAEDPITREQTAAILCRYTHWKGLDVSGVTDGSISDFLDSESISAYAAPAIRWAAGSGILKGDTESRLNPSGYTTRAQLAVMLMRFYQAVLEG